MALRVLDLFCGCGGLSFGFALSGFDVVLGVDKDKSSLVTFAANHPGSLTLEADLSLACPNALSEAISGVEVDVIIGGPPCQGLSLSGLRLLDDPRNKLLLSFVKVLAEIQPNAFVMENVPGLVGLFDGQYKNLLMQQFEHFGYGVSMAVLNAAAFGVPQLRTRVFFVGMKGKTRKFVFPQASHYPDGSIFLDGGDARRHVTCDDALSDLPSLQQHLGDVCQDYPIRPQNDYQRMMREDSEVLFNHVAAKHSEAVKSTINLVPQGGNYKDLPLELRDTRKFHVAWTRLDGNKPSPTVDTGHRHHFHYKFDRVPTVREHARLQSFPDRFVFSGNKTQQFAQVGNAVPPLLARAIAEALREQL